MSGKTVSYENGTFRYGLSETQLPKVNWLPYVKYHLVAVRFAEESGKELLREQILSLPDEIPEGASNQLSFIKSVVDSYFSQAEWEALISQKPNWEFVLS